MRTRFKLWAIQGCNYYWESDKMLENVTRKSTIYQHPQDYILGKDTFYVENFTMLWIFFKIREFVLGINNISFVQTWLCAIGMKMWTEEILQFGSPAILMHQLHKKGKCVLTANIQLSWKHPELLYFKFLLTIIF